MLYRFTVTVMGTVSAILLLSPIMLRAILDMLKIISEANFLLSKKKTISHDKVLLILFYWLKYFDNQKHISL